MGGVTHKQISLYICSLLTFLYQKQFKKMTKKRLYEKPSMKVVLLKRQPQLLAGSNNLDDYNWNDYQEE